MKISADKSQVMEIYCDWLKNNCDRYEYLTDEAKKLHADIKNMDINSYDAKGFYLQFMEMFVNNPFIAASSGHLNRFNERGEHIVSYDYRCYFIKNKFDMWVPLELYCRLATYKTPVELDQMIEQENTSLKNGLSEYKNMANAMDNNFKRITDDRNAKFGKYLKGPREVKVHPLLAILNIGLSSKVLWDMYQHVQAVGFENFARAVQIGGGVAALILANSIIQSLLEFKNKSKKNSVRAILRRVEQAQKTIEEGNEAALAIMPPLSEFVSQMLKAGKSGVSDAETLKKAQISSWSQKEYEQWNKDYEVLENTSSDLKPHTKFRYLIVAAALYVALIYVKDGSIDNLKLPDFLKFGEKETEATQETTTGAVALDEATEEWRISAGECNLRAEPDGDVITTLMQGESVNVLSWNEDGTWLEVEAEDGNHGWISRRVVKRIFSDEIAIVSAEATSELKTKNSGVMSIENALDGVLLTSWQEGASGYGLGEQITLVFDDTYEVDRIIIYNGNLKTEDSYVQNGRLKKIAVWNALDEEEGYYCTIEDEYNLEGSEIIFDKPIETNSIIIGIEEVFEGTKYQDTCISEITAYGH